MPKTKGGKSKREPKEKRPPDLTKEDYDELVKKADFATASLYPLRHRARELREDIDKSENLIGDVEKDIKEYIEEIAKRIEERVKKLREFCENANNQIYEIELSTKKRLKEIDEEKEEIAKKQTRIEGDSEILRVRLGQFRNFEQMEQEHRRRIEELQQLLSTVLEEGEQKLHQLKTDFTRDLRNMREDYEKKISLTNEFARKLIRPCVAAKINCMRESNTNLAHDMRRMSQKRIALYEKMAKIQATTNRLRYQYELWRDVERRKLLKCDPRISQQREHSPEREMFRYDEDVGGEELAETEVPQMKLSPYKELKRTLRLLLRPDDNSTDSTETREREEEISGEFTTNSDSDSDGATKNGKNASRGLKAK